MEYIVLFIIVVVALMISIYLSDVQCKRARLHKEYQYELDKKRRERASIFNLKPFEDYDNGRDDGEDIKDIS
jgi:hypothetical protein